MLTNRQITKFQKIYKDRFGKKVSRDFVLEKGPKLIRLMQIVYSPITKNEYKEFEKFKKTNN